MTKAIIVTSGKGGVGKTSFCAGVGSALAMYGRECLIIDADAPLRSLDLTLGIYETALFDFYDVYSSRVDLENATVSPEGIPSLHILSAPSFCTASELPSDALETVVRMAKRTGRYEYIFIDCPAGVGEGFRMSARGADSAIVVSGTDRVSLRCADRTARALSDLGIDDSYLVVNRVKRKMLRSGLNIDDAMDISGLPLLGYVPEDEEMQKCLRRTAPYMLSKKRKKYDAHRAYENIALRITGENVHLMRK